MLIFFCLLAQQSPHLTPVGLTTARPVAEQSMKATFGSLTPPDLKQPLHIEGNWDMLLPGSAQSVEFHISGNIHPASSRARFDFTSSLGNFVLFYTSKRMLIYSEDLKMYSFFPLARGKSSPWIRFLGVGLDKKLRSALLSPPWSIRHAAHTPYRGQHAMKMIFTTPPDKSMMSEKIRLDQIFTFWQKGLLNVWIDRDSKQWLSWRYQHLGQQVNIEFKPTFIDSRLAQIELDNDSIGFDSTGTIEFSYNDSIWTGFNLSLSSSDGRTLNGSMNWSSEPSITDYNIVFMPPFGSIRASSAQFKLLWITNALHQLSQWKKAGLNIKTLGM